MNSHRTRYNQFDQDHIASSNSYKIYDNHFTEDIDDSKKLFLFSIWVDEYKKSLVSSLLLENTFLSFLIERIKVGDENNDENGFC
jgi:hypothetical protein